VGARSCWTARNSVCIWRHQIGGCQRNESTLLIGNYLVTHFIIPYFRKNILCKIYVITIIEWLFSTKTLLCKIIKDFFAIHESKLRLCNAVVRYLWCRLGETICSKCSGTQTSRTILPCRSMRTDRPVGRTRWITNSSTTAWYHPVPRDPIQDCGKFLW